MTNMEKYKEVFEETFGYTPENYFPCPEKCPKEYNGDCYNCPYSDNIPGEEYKKPERGVNMRDYREKTVNGISYNGHGIPKPCPVTVRMTKNNIGESLSLAANGHMIMIPLEAVRDIIKITERG